MWVDSSGRHGFGIFHAMLRQRCYIWLHVLALLLQCREIVSVEDNGIKHSGRNRTRLVCLEQGLLIELSARCIRVLCRPIRCDELRERR